MISPPPPVRPGDRVGVAALSGVVDEVSLQRGVDALEAMGFETVVAANVSKRWGIFAGDENDRLDGFHTLVEDQEIKAIFFARGGAGVLGLLPRINWELLGKTPRAFVGYSDLTPFLLQVVQRLGWSALHGPMVAPDLGRGLSDVERDSLLKALAGESQTLRAPHCYRTGQAEGLLLGGCLSMLVSTLGTDWAPDLSGALLLLEDVGEPDYRIDRMLTQLQLSGSLKEIKGMVLGYLGSTWDSATTDEWQDCTLGCFSGPIVGGFRVGHGVPNYTLPLGLTARLDGSRGELTFGL